MLTDNPHIKNTASTIEAKRDGTVDVVLIVFTDLELDALHPDYNKRDVDDLIIVAQQHMRGNPAVLGKIRLTTIR